MDLYFERHDGHAVTCDDFRAAMADANGADLTQLERWYSQAGTPVVRAEGAWDEAAQTYTLTLEQSCPATPGQPDKEPFYIPVACGLLDAEGNDLVGTRVLELREARQEFVFGGVTTEPTPSLLRNFSAPVKLRMGLTDEQLAFLLAHDSDAFNRWEAGQTLGTRVVLGLVDDLKQGRELHLDERLLDAFRQTLLATDLDQSLQAYALRLPGERTLGEEMDVVLPHELHAAREFAVKTLARAMQRDLLAIYHREAPQGGYRYSPAEAGRRRVRNLCLGYLASLEAPEAIHLCEQQFASADNMTDQLTALACLASIPGPACDRVLGAFYDQWKGVPLVVDKWLSVQAGADRDDTLQRVDALLSHPAYDIRNPNKVRALVRVFFRNQAAFHVAGGDAYRWVADRILELDALNPQMSARTADAFTPWRRFDASVQGMMKAQLERIAGREGISKNLFEIVSKSLAS
jgi:aminopeptidase N